MRKWYTQVIAKDPKDQEIKIWDGPYIEAPTQELAQQYCDTNGLGYVHVTPTWVVEEIDEHTGKKTIYEHIN